MRFCEARYQSCEPKLTGRCENASSSGNSVRFPFGYGKAAPILRNHEMVDLADRVLVVWDGESRGTKDTIAYAKQQQKEIEVVIYIAPNMGK